MTEALVAVVKIRSGSRAEFERAVRRPATAATAKKSDRAP
ncbi:hypothetical protein ATK30_0146 [Amycolatopsis echigonensis]|uniref:Antibiotic biosynthesis monooxygenase n=1 Tax=Amycolatopsis echigonensis TaxID=2576905 RepID=A0A2N3X1S8_9PSEU|nr:hypothetical protein ATK30_0146 [Amycolatopsis niigatensis]